MKRINLLKTMFWFMLIFYLFLLITILFIRTGADYRSINLIPFATISEYINVYDGIRTKRVDVNVWGNMLLFIPAGIYFMLFAKNRSAMKVFCAILYISISVEIIQFIFAIGASDIDDVILNTAGGGLGILFYSILHFLFKSQDRVKRFISALSMIVGVPLFFLTITLYYVNR